MAFKSILIVCALALLIQSTFSQCFGPAIAGRPGPFGLAGPAFAPAIAPAAAIGPACGAVSSTGGGFPVTSASPIAPTGVSVVSENAIEGALAVGGNLPLLGSVGLEGAFPTAGAGAVSYGCGDGAVGINSESPIATGILGPGPAGPGPALASGALGAAGLGFGSGAVNGLGYNGLGRGFGGSCGTIY